MAGEARGVDEEAREVGLGLERQDSGDGGPIDDHRQGEELLAAQEIAQQLQIGRFTWSQLIRKVYEIDPLLCPFCGATMRIVAFLIDFASLRRLLGHLGFAPQQPEPLAHSPPVETERYVFNA